jgi:hypothetical protein
LPGQSARWGAEKALVTQTPARLVGVCRAYPPRANYEPREAVHAQAPFVSAELLDVTIDGKKCSVRTCQSRPSASTGEARELQYLQVADNLRSKAWLLMQIEVYESGTEMSAEAMLAKLREELPGIDHWGIVGTPGKHMALMHKKPTVRLAPPAIAGHNVAVYSICTGAGAKRARERVWQVVSSWGKLPGERVSEFEIVEVGGATGSVAGSAASSAASSAAGGGFVTAREAFELVKDMSNRDFTLHLADLKVQEQVAKQRKETLPPPERTILLLRAEVDTMRQKRLAARGYLRHVATAGTLVWPDDFVNLSLIEGRLMNELTGEDDPLTLTKYLTSSMHLRVTCLFYGPPGTGKTPWRRPPRHGSHSRTRKSQNIMS